MRLQAGKAIPSASIACKQSSKNAYPCYGGNGLRGYVELFSQTNAAVLIGRQGALCGNVCFADGEYYATEHAVVAVPNAKLNADFAYHLLLAANLNQYKTAGAQPGLSVARLKNVKIQIPSLAAQQRIVDILNKFDALINDISSGLPAEIEARRKQYEYYRDKLLTLKEKVA